MQLWWLCNLVLIIGPSKAEKGLHKPAGPITARVWTNSSSSPPFVYPELSDGEFGMPLLQRKPNLGICVSGGEPVPAVHVTRPVFDGLRAAEHYM